MAEVINLNMFGGETPQVSIMPTPSPELAGKILQYAGATDENFTAGYFYRCVTTGGTSSWQRVNVQPSGAGTSWGGIDGDIADQTDLAEALNGKTGRFDVTFVVDTTEQLATKTAVMGDTAIVKTTGKMHTYGSTWDGGVNGEYGVIYIGENEQYVWDTTKFVLISTEDAKTLNGKDEGYFAKDSEAAKRDGSYPLMNVGSADNLTGGFKVSREFSEDTAGGSADISDSVVKVERIKGNSVIWSQLIHNGDFSDGKNRWSNYNTNFSVNNNIATCTHIGSGNSWNGIIQYTISEENHKYLIVAEVYRETEGGEGAISFSDKSGSILFGSIELNKWVKISGIVVGNKNSTNDIIYIRRGYMPVGIEDTTHFRNIKQFDLTQIFGAGNEPATIEKFEKMFPLDYYDYNKGEIINLNLSGIKTQGFNAYNPTTGKAYVIGGNQYQITGAYTSVSEGDVAITPDSDGKFTPSKNGELTIAGGDSTTTCVHLVWSGKRNGEYEEYWEETRNIDLQSILYQGSPLFADGLCSVGEVYDELTATKAFKRIGNRDYEEGDEDNASVLTDGTTTLYVLESPIEVEFAEPLNLNYRVSDFGTETLLPINDATPVTAPIKIDVEYGLNVVDTVRNLSRNYLGMSGTQNTFAAIAAALSAYGMSMTLGDYDETNKYYPVTISGGWKPANAVPASATAAGSRGEYYIDAEYFYVCVNDATWKRFALSSW